MLENAALHYQKSTKTWFMFVNHIGKDERGNSYSDSIRVYWTKDINKWDVNKKAVVVDGSVSWSKKVIGLPSVVQVKDRLAIFYDGADPMDYTDPIKYHMNRDIGLAWVDLPIKAN